ncbi:hypothetical protein [Fictibacillus phosphorivorans]|uniref:hypothetical protein n=1 Tax=Fictibacillus phosphorivorans TaxID=1221500 RepID=UPI001293B232|nr:hypothetical protein [Fictibacillus phosphorivorans]MQR94161.1 hypothetical protein [Fictibacillus phosphorivorans]
MNTLEYRLEDKQTVKTFEEISSLETSVRFFVNYWVNEGKVYENRGNYFTHGKYFIDLYECKDEQPYVDGIEKVPNTIEYRLFHPNRKIIKESTETNLEGIMVALSLDSVTIDNNTYKRLSLEFDEDRGVYVYYLNG